MEYLDVCEKIGNVLLWIVGPGYFVVMTGAILDVLGSTFGSLFLGKPMKEFRMKSHIR